MYKYENKIWISCHQIYLIAASVIWIMYCFFREIHYLLHGSIYETTQLVYVLFPFIKNAVYYFAALMISSISYFEIYSKYSTTEVLDSIAYKKADRNQLVVVIAWHFLFTSVILMVGMAGAHFVLHASKDLLLHMAGNLLFHYTLIGLLAILTGRNLAYLSNGYLRIPLMLIIIFLISPIRANAFYGQKLDFSLLEIFPDNIDWVPNGYLGYPVQMQRLAVILFWIVCNLIILSVIYKKNDILIGTGLILSFLLLRISMLPGTMLTGSSASGAMNQSQTYYQPLLEDHISEKREPDFAVTRYTMEFTVTNQLAAVVTMELSNAAKKQYPFTLYHEYQIEKITDQNGRNLKYQRKNDYLIIQGGNTTETVTIQYHGTGTPFYSEYAGTYLTCGLPFFPMAGFFPVYDRENMCFTGHELEQTAEFDIRINAYSDFYCNLEMKDKNHFAGKDRVLFLLSGMVQEYRVGDIRFLYPSTFQKNLVEEQLSLFIRRMQAEHPEYMRELSGMTFVRIGMMNEVQPVKYRKVIMSELFTCDYLMAEYPKIKFSAQESIIEE